MESTHAICTSPLKIRRGHIEEAVTIITDPSARLANTMGCRLHETYKSRDKGANFCQVSNTLNPTVPRRAATGGTQ